VPSLLKTQLKEKINQNPPSLSVIEGALSYLHIRGFFTTI